MSECGCGGKGEFKEKAVSVNCESTKFGSGYESGYGVDVV